MKKFPKEFEMRMRSFPDFDYEEWEACMQKPAHRGIRINTAKCDEETLKEYFPFELKKAPFSSLSYYLPGDYEGIGRSALHHAGAFYVQEPSASSAVSVLDPQPNDRILDLCAAPGGKSTQIAALLGDEGLLWSNEIVKNRAQILLSNVERMGIRNAVVSSCHPDVLCSALKGFFDKILVDAPCSGEGMFGRDEKAIDEWSEEHVKTCAVRQLAILNSAAQALRCGGHLVYSTCTFSPEENEGVVTNFLKENPDFEIIDSGVTFGREAYPQFADGDEKIRFARRIFPMDGGEGHFVAKFRRNSENECRVKDYKYQASDAKSEEMKMFKQLFSCECYGVMSRFGEKVVILPKGLPELNKLGVIRAGVAFGELKKNRIEPEHAVFAAARRGEAYNEIVLDPNSKEMAAFLRGEEIPCEKSGYTAVFVGNAAVGFGKASGGMLKNRYPKGLRNM